MVDNTGDSTALTLQQKIDEITWYHDIDFPGGLQARTKSEDAGSHRKLWTWMRSELDKIDFTGKDVLDIGCWDGYWSFYAEKRDAASVLASDDCTQNWSGNRGLVLAKELMGSSVETRTDVSIYEASKLDRRFDIILCMGVYYHLVDPFYAFSEVRHCCHESSTVVFEGDFFDLAEPAPPAPSLAGRIVRGLVRANKLLLGGVTGDPPSTDPITDSPIQANYDFGHPGRCFVPSVQGLCKMLEANYFRVLSQSIYHGDPAQPVRRVLLTCQPFTGENPLHCTRPPFGLHRYDPRYA